MCFSLVISSRRGEFGNMEYLQSKEEKSSEKIRALSVLIRFSIPFSEMLAEFYDHLKSCSRGYASLDYRFADYVDADLIKLDIIIRLSDKRKFLLNKAILFFLKF